VIQKKELQENNAVFLFLDLLAISFVRHLLKSDIRSRVTDKINDDLSTTIRV